MVRHRPNKNCLFCDEVIKNKPTPSRAFYTCGNDCWKCLNRSLNLFNPKVNRRRGQNMLELAVMWWVIRTATEPIPHHQIRERMRNHFGDWTVFKDRLTSFSLKYFVPDCYTVTQTRNVMLYECEDRPFNEVLRSKYLDVITNSKYRERVGW